MATRNINLTDALDAYVAELVATGRYQNASEVVRAGLCLLKGEQEKHARKLAALEALIEEGADDIAAGRFEVVDDLDEYFRKLEADVDAEIAAEAAAARSHSPRPSRLDGPSPAHERR